MTSPLIDRLPNTANPVLYSPQLLSTLAANKARILAKNLYYAIDIDYSIRARYVGDLIGLLMERRIPEKLHVMTLLLNDIADPADYDGIHTPLLVPHEDVVEDIILRHKTLY